MKRIILLIIGSLIIISSWWLVSNENKVLTVTFLDIGQGDASIIRTPAGETIIIDGGPDRKILSKLGKYIPWSERIIDLVVLTHPHADHLAGLNYVLERYKVRHILMTEAVHTTPEYLRFLELLKEKNIPVSIALTGQAYIFSGGLRLEVIWPHDSLADKKISDLNESSIVCRLVYGSTAFLFTGDTPAKNEQAILQAGLEIRADVLKVAHQGSKTSSIEEFIKAVSPEYAIISVGPNSYGHPHQEVVTRLRQLVPYVWRTDEQGDITFLSQGRRIEPLGRNLIFLKFMLP